MQKFFSEIKGYANWLVGLSPQKIGFWLECARAYSLPITVLSWAVIFVYSLKFGRTDLIHEKIFSAVLGLICLVGVACVHMATNLIDDYYDYRILSLDVEFMNSAQECKCRYLKEGLATKKELKFAIITFLLIAVIIGSVLFCTVGMYVAFLALAGLVVAVFYQKLSLVGLGELAVIIAYGPLLFEGTYYVMTGDFSWTVFLLSVGCSTFTNTILYAHMLMDFDGDKCSHKTTICQKLKTKNAALNFILVFYLTGLLAMIGMSFRTGNFFYCLPWLTLFMIADLYKSLKTYNEDKTNVPKVHFWHKPLDNWAAVSKTEDAPFYFRFFYSRNIVTWFMVLVCVAILTGRK